jgi:hypothetical protein
MSTTPYVTSPVTPVPAKLVEAKPIEAEISYLDARKEAVAADLAVQDAERALAAAITVRGIKANAAAEAGWHESVDREGIERKRNQDITAKAHADAFDRAHEREKDVVNASPTSKTLPVSQLPIANEGEVLLNTQDRVVTTVSK